VVDEVQEEEVEGENDDEERGGDALEEPAGAAGRKRKSSALPLDRHPVRDVGTLATVIAPVSTSEA